VDSIFIFIDKFLSQSGAIFLFHSNDLQILKQIKEFLDNYSMSIQMKWVAVNNFPFVTLRILGWKYISLPIFSLLFLFLVFYSNFQCLFSSCKLYSIGLCFLWGSLRLLSFKHLLLAYLSSKSGLWRKIFCTTRLIAPQW
jgi:hypothetical protein